MRLGGVRLVNSDNYSWQPDNSIDLILTDPPFNIARDTNFHTYEKNTIHSYRFDADKGWDSYSREDFVKLMESWAIDAARVLRPGGSFAFFCADDYISDLKLALEKAGLKPRRTVTWRKPNAVPINSQYMMMSACEYIVVGVKGKKATFNSSFEESSPISPQESAFIADKLGAIVDMEVKGLISSLSATTSRSQVVNAIEALLAGQAGNITKRVSKLLSTESGYGLFALPNLVTFNSAGGKRIHPTEKPVALLKFFISLMSNPGDIVLDPFAGSASTGHAAIESGRKAVLVEQDKDFYSKAIERIKDVIGPEDSLIT